MHHILRKSVVLFLVAALVLVPLTGAVFAGEPYEKEDISSGELAADLMIVRPMGIVSMIAGSILFLFSLPFSFSEENMDQNREEIGENVTKFIVEPAKYTFNRRLGDM